MLELAPAGGLRLALTAVLLLAGCLAGLSAARGEEPFHGAPSVAQLLAASRDEAPSPEHYPWSAIGRFERPIAGGCTGVLIGRSIVLTAAHCLYDPYARRWLSPAALVFTTGERSAVRGYRVAPGYLPNARPALLSEGDDLALVLLADAAGDRAGFIPWLRSGELKPALDGRGGMLFAAGYPEGDAGAMRLQGFCQIAEFFEQRQVFTHSCVSLKGESGAPVLSFAHGRYSVAGIEVGAAGVRSDGHERWGAATTLQGLERMLAAWPRFAPLSDRAIWGDPHRGIPAAIARR